MLCMYFSNISEIYLVSMLRIYVCMYIVLNRTTHNQSLSQARLVF